MDQSKGDAGDADVQFDSEVSDALRNKKSRFADSTADDFEKIVKIGGGSSGVVWKAKHKELDEYVAIKIMDLESLHVSLDDLRKEIQLMNRCQHANVVNYYGSFVHEDCLWIVMEYLEGGSVSDIMRYGYKTGFKEEIVAMLLKESLKALVYFHSNGQIHRDIKGGNILVNGQGQVKIADFGVAVWLENSGRALAETLVGTPCWMAPEVMKQTSGYNKSVDIWSLGITAIELAKGKAPLASFAPMQVMIHTIRNPPPTLGDRGDKFTKSFRDFVDSCLNKDPDKRPTATQLLDHKFLKNAKKSEFIVQRIMQDLPPLEERYSQFMKDKLKPLNLPIDAQAKKKEPEKQVPDEEWSFPSGVDDSPKSHERKSDEEPEQPEEKTQGEKEETEKKEAGRFKIKQTKGKKLILAPEVERKLLDIVLDLLKKRPDGVTANELLSVCPSTLEVSIQMIQYVLNQLRATNTIAKITGEEEDKPPCWRIASGDSTSTEQKAGTSSTSASQVQKKGRFKFAKKSTLPSEEKVAPEVSDKKHGNKQTRHSSPKNDQDKADDSIAELKKTVAHHGRQIAKLSTNFTSEKDKETNVFGALSIVSDRLKELIKENSELKDEVQALKAELFSLKRENESLKTKIGEKK